MYNVHDYNVITLLAWIYVRVGILLTCGKHLHDHIISLKGDVWGHKTSLTQPRFTEVPVPSKEYDRSCIYVVGYQFCLFLRFDI